MSHYPVTVITDDVPQSCGSDDVPLSCDSDNVPLSYGSDDVPLPCHLVSRVLRRRLLLRVLIGCELSDESSPLAVALTNPLTVGCCDVDNDDDIGVLLDSGLSADNTAHTVKHG